MLYHAFSAINMVIFFFFVQLQMRMLGQNEALSGESILYWVANAKLQGFCYVWRILRDACDTSC